MKADIFTLVYAVCDIKKEKCVVSQINYLTFLTVVLQFYLECIYIYRKKSSQNIK